MPEKEQGPEAPPLHPASEQPPPQQEINDMENFEIFSKFSKKKLTNNILMSIISISMQIYAATTAQNRHARLERNRIMIKSMTGFGRFEAVKDKMKIARIQNPFTL